MLMVRYWVVRMQIDDGSWNVGEAYGFVGIGWAEVNPTNFSWENKELLVKEYEKQYPKEIPKGYEINEMLKFVNDINKGDVVILPCPENSGVVYLIGKVKSRCAYYEENQHDNAYEKTRRDVEWVSSFHREWVSEPLRNSLNAQWTIFNVDKHGREISSYIP